MNISIAKVAFVVAIFVTQVASALDAIPPPSWDDDAVSATTARDPVAPLQMGDLEITLEKTSLEEVQTAIGSGKIYRHGDASEALAWLCYSVLGSNSKQRVWLSSGEMHGLTTIDGVTAVEISTNDSPSESCPELPKRFMPLRFSNGIWLGTSENGFRKIFGEGKKENSTRSYIYIDKDGEYDIIGSLNVRFKNHVSVAINGSHVTSN